MAYRYTIQATDYKKPEYFEDGWMICEKTNWFVVAAFKFIKLSCLYDYVEMQRRK